MQLPLHSIITVNCLSRFIVQHLWFLTVPHVSLQVKSTSASLVTGSHRFVIELYDTTTEHDVIISHEMVATGHAQTSPEGTKVCLGFSWPLQGMSVLSSIELLCCCQ